MNFKKKGIDAERELIKLFWENRWAALRSAGSGSSQYPSPDIIASNKLKKIAIESKMSSTNSKFFEKKEIQQLLNFCDYFGCESWIAVKFKTKKWFFFTIDNLKETNKGYSINIKDCELKGLNFQEMITL